MLHKRVGEDHIAADFAEDAGAEIHHPRIAIHQVGQQVAREDYEGDAEGEAEAD